MMSIRTHDISNYGYWKWILERERENEKNSHKDLTIEIPIIMPTKEKRQDNSKNSKIDFEVNFEI